MRLLAVDPGTSGAYAFFSSGMPPVVDDLPVVEKSIDVSELSRLIKVLKPEVAIVERVGAMPNNSPNSMFTFGRAVGAIQATILCAGMPLHLVTPQVWKKKFNLGADKERARELAIRLFPQTTGLSRKRDVDRAEALLIGHWFMETRNVATASN